MLERLRIRDLALVDEAAIPFEAGLNVVTGETGAGKSLVVEAISLLMGGKPDADTVREGAEGARIEGEFRVAGATARRVAELLAGWNVEFDGETVIVRRDVSAAGRSRATVNESAVTQAALRRLGEALVDLHGQHEHQSLLREGAGLDVLDALAGLDLERDAYAERWAAWRESQAEEKRIEQTLATFAERRDVLRHAAAEIDDARLEAGEDEALRQDAARLQHSDRLRQLVSGALDRLAEGEGAAAEALAAAGHALGQAAALDDSLAALVPTLEEARIAAGETARALAAYAEGLEADPATLEAIETRRDLLSRLTHKYRRDVPALIAWRAELEAEIATGEDGEGALDRAGERERLARGSCADAARALSRARVSAAREWGTRVTKDLRPLGMPAARLEFRVTSADPASAAFGPRGVDDVALAFTANPGESARPLERIASGGELSRVMLALKTALEAQDRVDLLVFDEVDSGIGGAVAHAVGERLRRLAQHRQILCVTHLPMIAALARHHLSVAKSLVAGRTVARVTAVRGDARIAELSRMLAGDRVTETTRRQARELLEAPAVRAGTR